MPPTASRINNLNDSLKGNIHKRKCNPCNRMKSNYEGVSLTLNAHAGKKSKYFDLPPRTVGDDGHYYECVVRDNDGELLCCDTCPCTYHLQCINPPLESVPTGTWQCENCCQGADLLAPLISLKSLKKKASSDKNAANHIGHEKRSDTSAVNEIKVYRRRARKIAVEKKEEDDPKNSIRAHGPSESANKDQQDRLTTHTSGLFCCSIIKSEFAEPADKVLENDDLNASRPQQPKEANPEAEAQGSEMVHQAMTTSDCSQSPNVNRYNMLWLLRDVMQESMKDHHFIQNNRKKELHQALPPKDTESAKAKRKKYARLRARQKQKIALRNRSNGLIPGSMIVKPEAHLQMDAEAIESVRVHTLQNESKEHMLQELFPLKEESTSRDKLLYKSAVHIDPRRSQYRQIRFRGKLPVFSSQRESDAGCSTRFSANSREIGDSDVSLQTRNPSAVPQGGKDHSWMSLGSSLASTSQQSKHADSGLMMSNNSIKDQAAVDFWLEEELDSLWIGVRRYGQGNWEAMLRDSSLSFAKNKTTEHLSQKWKMERLRISSPGNLANSLSMDQRLNCLQVADTTLPSLKDRLPSKRGNLEPQNLLLGGLINIPRSK